METQSTNEQIKEISALINQPEPTPKVEEVVEEEISTDTEDLEVEDNADLPEDLEEEVIEEIASTETEEGDVEVEKLPSTIKEWAEAIDVDPSQLFDMSIPMPDGKDPVRLGELKNLYSEQLRNEARLQAQIKQYEEQGTQVQQQSQASQAKINTLGKLNEIQRKYETTDWATLDKDDPGNSALLRQKFLEANTQLNNELQNITVTEQQQQQQFHAQQLQQSAAKVMELMPEWSDTEVRTKDVESVQTLLQSEGLSQQQINNLQDPMAIKLLNELAHLRKQVGNVDKAVKKVKRAPKRINNTARTKKSTKKRDDLIAKAKSTHNKHDEVAAVKNLLNWD